MIKEEVRNVAWKEYLAESMDWFKHVYLLGFVSFMLFLTIRALIRLGNP